MSGKIVVTALDDTACMISCVTAECDCSCLVCHFATVSDWLHWIFSLGTVKGGMVYFPTVCGLLC